MVKQLLEDLKVCVPLKQESFEHGFFRSQEYQRECDIILGELTSKGMDAAEARQLLTHETVWVDVAHDGLRTFDNRADKTSNVVWLRLRSVPIG